MIFLPEDPDERRMFDEAVNVYGSPLAAIHANLQVMSKAAPPEGSYGKMLAIWANEIFRAMIPPSSRDRPFPKVFDPNP